jgi:hypothetical protein
VTVLTSPCERPSVVPGAGMIGSWPRHCKLLGKRAQYQVGKFLLEFDLKAIRHRRGGFHGDANTSQKARNRTFSPSPGACTFFARRELRLAAAGCIDTGYISQVSDRTGTEAVSRMRDHVSFELPHVRAFPNAIEAHYCASSNRGDGDEIASSFLRE